LSFRLVYVWSDDWRFVGFEKVLLLQNTFNLPVSEVIETYVYRGEARAGRRTGIVSSCSDASYWGDATDVGCITRTMHRQSGQE
jgi:hypothetical protein